MEAYVHVPCRHKIIAVASPPRLWLPAIRFSFVAVAFRPRVTFRPTDPTYLHGGEGGAQKGRNAAIPAFTHRRLNSLPNSPTRGTLLVVVELVVEVGVVVRVCPRGVCRL